MTTMATTDHPRPDNHVIVLFGATGDLAKRKLLPGLYHLYVAGLLPKGFRIIGSSPHAFACTDEEFRAHAKDAVTQFCNTKPNDRVADFENRLSFAAAELGNATDWGCHPRRTRRSAARSGGCTTWPCRPSRSPRSSRCSARPGWPTTPG